jgi:hypothetical protein
VVQPDVLSGERGGAFSWLLLRHQTPKLLHSAVNLTPRANVMFEIREP